MAYERESSKVLFHNPGGEEELMPLTSAYHHHHNNNNNNNNNNNSLFTPPSQWNSLKDSDGFHSYFLSELYRYYQQKPSSPITKQLLSSIIDSFDRRLPPSYDDHHKAGVNDNDMGAMEEKDGAKLLSLSGEKKEIEKEEGVVKEKDYSEADKEFNDRSIWKMVSSDVLKRVKNENIDLVNIKKSSGLTDDEAAKRLTENGPNVLTPPPEKPEILKYLLFYLDPFMLLLVGAGILSCIAYGLDKTQPINLWIGIVLFVVVVISCTFSYFQEGAATAVMKSFKKLLPRNARVIRGGQVKTVPASELVVGDLVVIQGGDQCPADLRMLFASNVKLETSALTGESVPVTSATIASSELKMEEARNIAFNTCYVIEGEGYGVVVATGDNSIIGKIAKLASGDGSEPLTPIQKEIKMFVKKIAAFALTMGIIFFVIGLARGQKPIYAFINGCIVVMIAMVPEGLPMTVVSALAIVAKRMGKLNVFIKQLRSVETLGSATVIASDKTGTITQNKMTVSRLWFDGAPFSADTLKRDFPAYDIRRRVRIGGNSGFTVKGNSATMKKKAIEMSQNHLGDTLYQLEVCAGVCNRAKYEDEKVLTDDEADMMNAGSVLRSLDPAMTLRSARDAFPVLASHIDPTMTLRSAIKKFDVRGANNKTGDSKIIGDASDTGLFNYVKNRSSVEMLRYHYRLLLEIPFNSRVKYAMSIVKPYRVEGAQNRILLIKGAPEVILTKCSHHMVKGVPHPIDDSFRSSFTEAYEMFGGYGERVLGFAQLVLDLKQYPAEYDNQYNAEKNNFPQSGYCFLGLISLIDPPKPTVFDAIASCHTAGVKVMMVTGDHPLTAAAIARQVGIITQPTRDVLAKARGVAESAIDESEVNAVVVRGVDIESYSEADWNRVLTKQEIVFARTTPTHKLEIVKNLQRLNHIVAVTGDGVNDSPALKQADLGVAMGISGSDVARNAADVIIMDDDLASIVVGIREGRTIFDNLAKTTAYTVSHMLPEVVPVLLNLAFGFPVILPALFILVIDLGTELAPAISLAYETAEGDIMTRPPRDSKKDRLVSLQVALYFIFQAGLIQTLSCFLAFFLVLNHHGIPPSAIPFSSDKYFLTSDSDCSDGIGDACTLLIDGKSFTLSHQREILNQAQTAYWTMLTASQVVHIFLNKTRKLSIFSHGLFDNTVMLFGVTIEIALIIIIIYVPFVQSFIGTTEFTARYWSIILVPITALFLINEPKKWLARKYPGSVFDQWLTF